MHPPFPFLFQANRCYPNLGSAPACPKDFTAIISCPQISCISAPAAFTKNTVRIGIATQSGLSGRLEKERQRTLQRSWHQGMDWLFLDG
jgi:hypothetical protein